MSSLPLYVGSFFGSDKAPIYRCEFNSDSGDITICEEYRDSRPSWLCKAENSDRLFFVREAESIDGVYGGGVGSFFGDMQSPVLLGIGASGPCHLCERDGNLFLACYREGALVEARWLGEDFCREVKIIRHEGSSVDPVRQSQAHPHFSLFTPDGKFLVVCDLGLDKIFFYPYDRACGISGEPIAYPTEEGRGPRHAVFSADGRYLYVITEMGGTILAYEYDGLGGINLISEITVMLRSEMGGEAQCAAIRLSPTGEELIATERRSGSIVFFAVDKNGMLSREGVLPTDAFPRDAVFSPDGRWILVANQQADTVGVYSYSADRSIPLKSRVKLHKSVKLPENSAPCALLFV